MRAYVVRACVCVCVRVYACVCVFMSRGANVGFLSVFPPLTYLRPIRAAREEHGGKGVIFLKKGCLACWLVYARTSNTYSKESVGYLILVCKWELMVLSIKQNIYLRRYYNFSEEI